MLIHAHALPVLPRQRERHYASAIITFS